MWSVIKTPQKTQLTVHISLTIQWYAVNKCKMSNIRRTWHLRFRVIFRLYLLGYPNIPIPFHSQTARLSWFNIAGNKTCTEVYLQSARYFCTFQPNLDKFHGNPSGESCAETCGETV
jgi:hypothetical protein